MKKIKLKSISTKARVSTKKSSDEMNKRIKKYTDKEGILGYSGSSYNGKGNVDHSKITSNKKRR